MIKFLLRKFQVFGSQSKSATPAGSTIRIQLSPSERASALESEPQQNETAQPHSIYDQDRLDAEVESQWLQYYSNLARAKNLVWFYMDSQSFTMGRARLTRANQLARSNPRPISKTAYSTNRILDDEIKSKWLAEYSNAALLKRRLWELIDSEKA